MAMTDYIVVPPRSTWVTTYAPPNEVINMRRLSPSPAGAPLAVPPTYSVPQVNTVDVIDQGIAARQLGLNGYAIVPKKGVVLNKPGDGTGGGSGPVPEYGQLWPLRG